MQPGSVFLSNSFLLKKDWWIVRLLVFVGLVTASFISAILLPSICRLSNGHDAGATTSDVIFRLGVR